MHENSTFRKKAEAFFAGQGFYIVLILCIAVIGASAWIIFRNTSAPDGDLSVSDTAGAEDALAQPPVIGVKPEVDTAGDESAETETETDVQPEPDAETGTDAADTDADETDAQTDGAAEQTQAAEDTPPVFQLPVNGAVSFDYAADTLVYNRTMADWRTHCGVDLEAELGARVAAAADGTVKAVGEDDLLGTTVLIEHAGGLCTLYANLAAVPTVSVGDSVRAGDVIGAVGDTAIGESSEVTHLHFAMTRDGVSVDPTDYLPR